MAEAELSPGGQDLLDEQRKRYDRVVAGDRLALLESFDHTAGLVFCAALALTGDRRAAEELTETLFVEFWRSPTAFPPSAGPLGLQMIQRLAGRGTPHPENTGPGGPGRAA